MTIAISKCSDDPVQVFRSAGLYAAPAINPHVRAALPEGWLALDVTDDGCSCSIYRSPLEGTELDELAHWQTRYERKGWTANKIARALESKREDRDRRRNPAREFSQAVARIIRSGGAVVLVAHSFQGLFAEEQVSIKAGSSLTLDEYLAREAAIPEDTLVIVE